MNIALTVQQVFQGRLLKVPDYQRSYAWVERNWRDFLDDLDLLPAGRVHYTGTVVLHARQSVGVLDKAGQKYERFDIVDGQQRLTTVVLLLDAIRRELNGDGAYAELAEGIEGMYIRGQSLAGQPLQKLELNADTNDYFAKVVLQDLPAPDTAANAAQERLIDARRFFVRYLEGRRGALGADFTPWLIDLFEKITGRLMLVPYEVADSAEVGVIFEVMNDRGRPLTELEKAKNYLLYLSAKLDLDHHDLTRQVNTVWAAIFRRLMAVGHSGVGDEDQLLRAHWLMAYDPLPRNWAGTASIKQLLSLKTYRGRHEELLAAATAYVDSLDRASVAYGEILDPLATGAFAALAGGDEGERRGLVHASARLLRLRALATFLPVLMAARLRYPTDAHAYLTVVDLCERFGFRVYRLLGRRSNAGQSGIYRAGHRLYRGDRDLAGTLDDLRGYLLYYAPNNRFAEEFSPASTRKWYGWYGLKYFLYEYEEHLAGKRPVLLPWDQLEKLELEKSIEHILPQTPEDPSWLTCFTEADRAVLTHDLGNLCITEDNSSYGRKPFSLKKGSTGAKDEDGKLTRCYANSILFQERALVAYDDWTPDTIAARRAELFSWARDRWSVEEALQPAEVDETEDDEAAAP